MNILELGHVVLYVTDIEKMANFYRNTLGFTELHREGPIALFSSGRTHHEMLLIEIGGSPKAHQRAEPGLYHIGFKVANSHDELKVVYRELKEKQVPIVGLADHGVTHSIYVTDPDGNELELYADVSDEWKTNPRAVLAPAKALNLD
jgi:catechol-2,3-dioxygenase